MDLWTRTGPRRSGARRSGRRARPRARRTADGRAQARGVANITKSTQKREAICDADAMVRQHSRLDAPARFSCIYIIVTAPWGGAAAPWSHRARATLDARRPSGAGRARPRGAAHDSGYCMGYCSHPIEGRDRGTLSMPTARLARRHWLPATRMARRASTQNEAKGTVGWWRSRAEVRIGFSNPPS